MSDILYIGPVFKESGYGVAATMNGVALARAGVAFSILPTDLETKPTGRYAEILGSKLVDRAALARPAWSGVIVHAVPSELATVAEKLPTGPKRIAYTTWESDPLPAKYAEVIRQQYDYALVPSTWNQRLLRGALGLALNVVPHPFDPDWWWAPSKPDKPRKTTTFYSVLTWNERKNPLGLLKAYFHAFSRNDAVKLIIVTPSWSRDDAKRLVMAMGLSDDLPKVEFRGVLGEDGRLSEEAYRRLHYESDCYVTASRAEGFGLGAFEAAVVGNAVIAPNYSAFPDFLSHYENARLYPCMETPVLYPETMGTEVDFGGIKVKTVTRNVHEGARGDQVWAEPDLVALSKAMREVHENKVPPKRQPEAFQNFTLDAVGHRFKTLLEAM